METQETGDSWEKNDKMKAIWKLQNEKLETKIHKCYSKDVFKLQQNSVTLVVL